MAEATERDNSSQSADAAGKRATIHLSWRKKIVFALLVPIGLVALGEIGVRAVCWVIGRKPYTAATPWCRANNDLMHDFKPGYIGPIFSVDARINRHGMRGPDIPLEKPAGTRRVLCLGDSRTFGYVIAAGEAYPARLEAVWRERFPDKPVQVLNAGTHGYTSYQGLRLLELRGLGFQPDIVTVAFGANDRRFVLRPEEQDGPEAFRRAARGLRWRNRMAFSYLLLGMNRAVQRFSGTITWPEEVLNLSSQRLPDLHCRVDVEPYRENLRKIARLCRDRKIACVFLAMTDAPIVREPLESARRLREEKKFEEAAKALSPILEGAIAKEFSQWLRPTALYELGLIRKKQNKPDEAQAAFRQSAKEAAFWSLMGGLPVRPPEPYLDAMKEVAREFSIPVVDIAERFSHQQQHYSDYWHYTAEGHREIANALMECLE